ncbi:MAG: Omp28-related outer membrane protein [Saprospiraceae bacterium]
MEKRTFMLMVTCLFVLKVGAQQVEEIQRTLLTKISATWCPPCGTWGWTMFDGLVEDNSDKAVLMAAHYSGLLKTDEAYDIFTNFGAFSQPRFFVNSTDVNVTSSNITAKRIEVMQMVADAYNSAPIANVGFDPAFANSTLSVNAKVKFFQATEGEFYLGIYLIEDGVVEFQQSIGNDAVHKKVLRTGFSDDTFGQPITNGTVNAGSEFDLAFSLQIGAVEGYDYEVAGIIWKKVNDRYIPVNVWSTKEIDSNATSTVDFPAINSFSINPNLTANQAFVNIDLQNAIEQAYLELIGINGEKITTIASGSLAKGLNSFQIDKSMVSVNGLYFVRLTDGKNVSTRQIVFQ